MNKRELGRTTDSDRSATLLSGGGGRSYCCDGNYAAHRDQIGAPHMKELSDHDVWLGRCWKEIPLVCTCSAQHVSHSPPERLSVWFSTRDGAFAKAPLSVPHRLLPIGRILENNKTVHSCTRLWDIMSCACSPRRATKAPLVRTWMRVDEMRLTVLSTEQKVLWIKGELPTSTPTVRFSSKGSLS